MADPRSTAAWIVDAVISDGRSLDSALAQHGPKVDPGDRGLLRALCYGTLRWLPQCEAALERLLKKPLRRKESRLRALLLVGLFQIRHLDVPEHAAVATCVDAASKIGAGWAKGLTNAVLRNAIRQQETLWTFSDDATVLAHPQWWLDRFKQAWPEHWQAIANANNQQAPMWLRVNRQVTGAADYQARLDAEGIGVATAINDALLLTTAVPAEALPDFAAGAVSVQDFSAQQVAGIMDAAPGQRILDACAAPGGKTCHLLEQIPDLDVTALDESDERLERLRANLQRLSLQANVRCGDASTPETWWDSKPYDRILVDAPCSGSGVIRRHPDIKRLRRADDMATMAHRQQTIISALWPLLAPGGRLIYTNCSVLPEENDDVIAAFLAVHDDAKTIPLPQTLGMPTAHGRQRLPGGIETPNDQGPNADGFFYTVLHKNAA